LATANPGKVREIRRALAAGGAAIRAVALDALEPVAPPAEDGATFADNARHKALYYARATGQWALADDSGLAVDALDGAPGVRSARYAAASLPDDAGRARIDAANWAKLLKALAGVPDARRTARFICHLAMADAHEVLLEAEGTVEGRIDRRPRGRGGFGYDPVFFVPQLGCTMAQLSCEQKNRISHRGRAVRLFVRRLATYLATR
jgi:XTP/dITP diphosphohydrolase